MRSACDSVLNMIWTSDLSKEVDSLPIELHRIDIGILPWWLDRQFKYRIHNFTPEEMPSFGLTNFNLTFFFLFHPHPVEYLDRWKIPINNRQFSGQLSTPKPFNSFCIFTKAIFMKATLNSQYSSQIDTRLEIPKTNTFLVNLQHQNLSTLCASSQRQSVWKQYFVVLFLYSWLEINTSLWKGLEWGCPHFFRHTGGTWWCYSLVTI
jgi:hypothetical protein